MRGLWQSYARYTRRVLAARRGGLTVYRDRLGRAAGDAPRVLHLGCGWDRSGVLKLLPPTSEVIGVDLDEDAGRRYPGVFVRADAAALPFPDDRFDLVCSEYVLEHIERPDAVLSELARVVRPGGRVVALAPNAWSYKSIAAMLTPHRLHELAARVLRADSREAGDVYPTRYRVNTRAAVFLLAALHGFSVEEFVFVNNGPTWFQRAPGLFELGRAFHWLIDQHDRLEFLRCGFVVTLRRRDPSRDRPATWLPGSEPPQSDV